MMGNSHRYESALSLFVQSALRPLNIPYSDLLAYPNISSSSNNSNNDDNNFNSNLDQLIRNELNDVNLCKNFKSPNSSSNDRRSINVNNFLNQRSYGNRTVNLNSDYGLRHLVSNNLLKENQIDLGQVDKIYSSCWLTEDFVVCGTKCSKLILINLNNHQHYFLPVVEHTTEDSRTRSGGLYSIAVNPSRTLLATGTKGGDIAIYRLPSLDIVYLLENGHTDVIFDIAWLDDHFLVSGSHDSNICLWKCGEESDFEIDESNNLFKMQPLQPIERYHFDKNKIRCLNFNRKRAELGVLAFYAKLNLIDALTMKKKIQTSLPQADDVVCLAHNEENLYAVGSKSHVQFIDSRSLRPVSTINSKEPQCGIRSLSFNSEILTVGTGYGSILFYDMRNSKYFGNNQDIIMLKTSKGWIQRPPVEQNYGHFSQPDCPAIYTHQYDETKTRLLTAGGPLTSSLKGNYCGLWF